MSCFLYWYTFGCLFSMKFIIKILISSFAVLITSKVLPGIQIDTFYTAVWVALVLGVLNSILKPVLVVLTIPITILTLGLFLLVVNAMIILLVDYFVTGFNVSTVGYAILFSLVLSVIQPVLQKLIGNNKK